MASNYKIADTNSYLRSGGMLVSFIMAIALVTCFFGKASAQRGNQSDWNVPPPLAPGTITKGDVEGRTGSAGTAVLTFTDVPAGVQPVASVGVPDLAPITNTAPDAAQPQQPEPGDVLAALPDLPMPGAPEMPGMPERTMQDAPEPLLPEVPMPAAPDMPPIPAEPQSSVVSGNGNAGVLPLMPEVSSPMILFRPTPGTTLWTTPSVAPTIDFKLIIRTN